MTDFDKIPEYGFIKESFNSMGGGNRLISINYELAIRIGDCARQKERLRENYEREIKHINSRINEFTKGIRENLKIQQSPEQ